MAHGTVEGLFHFVDTVNIKTKASETKTCTQTMVRKIWAQEGVTGFGRGIGAAIYGNYSSGFIYFVLYKYLKTNIPDYFGNLRLLVAGFVAETIAIIFKFPFDLVKCRLQSVNYIFKYSDWTHGLKKEFRNNGIGSLYQGVVPYLITYTTFTALQFSIYEHILKDQKSRMPPEVFHRREFFINMAAGGTAGAIAAAVTNSLEAITVSQQTNPNITVSGLIKKEGF